MESCTVYIQNAGTALEEFGIIKSRTEYTDAVEAAVSDYITRRIDEWTGQYMVEEFPKLQAADYKTFGQYTVYAILSDADKEAFYSAIAKFIEEWENTPESFSGVFSYPQTWFLIFTSSSMNILSIAE